MTKKSAIERDEECIGRAQRRLLRAYKRLRKFGGWRAVGAEVGVNHGNVIALVKHGTVRKSVEIRLALGLPAVLPSEREQRKKAKMETMTIEQYRALLERSGQKSKYRNVRTEVDGFVFASGLEARRYGELKLLEAAGEIHDLQLQVPFHLDVDGEHICDYVADFVYWTGLDTDGVGGRRSSSYSTTRVVEDAKGKRTAVYLLKKKLMLAIHGIEILETR